MPHSSIAAKTRGQAKRLRRDMTDAESRLWIELRGHRLTELHFRRQAPIGPYIADFICHEAKLVIELDGEQHALGAGPARDTARDAWFARKGYSTLRFWNHEVFRELDSITDTIFARCAERLPTEHRVNSPLPYPPPQGGRGSQTSRSKLQSRKSGIQKAASSENVANELRRADFRDAQSLSIPSPLVGEGKGGG